MKRFTITTLGCKVNQCESSAVGGILEASGYGPAPSGEQSDLIIINTCTVTGKAAMQSRQAIRQAIRKNPRAKIVVTGCYAQTAPDEIKNIEGIDAIVGHTDKMSIVERLDALQPGSGGPAVIHKNIRQATRFAPLPSVAPESRTRSYLKVQDGCNAFCTYCIVPHARGRSRSMPVEDALNHVDSLSLKGYKEVVLTGIHLGAYGKDLDPPSDLCDLILRISRRHSELRLRLSSIEPAEVDTRLIELVAAPDSIVCPHFHIPLQSGDDNVLKRMGRPYTGNRFARTIANIRTALPHAAIGVDVLVGFPGEDDRAFNRTFELLESLDITYLHVFPFSPRKGTPAAKFKEKVPDPVVKDRCRRLRQLGEEKKTHFYRTSVGRTVTMLVEKVDNTTGIARGMSETYIPMHVTDHAAKKNTLITAKIKCVKEDLTVLGATQALGKKS